MPTARRKTPARKAAPAKKYPTGAYHVAHMAAPNSPSGNPRRLYVATHARSNAVFAFDEGYAGWMGVPAAVRSGRRTIAYSVKITASEYSRLRKLYPA